MLSTVTWKSRGRPRRAGKEHRQRQPHELALDLVPVRLRIQQETAIIMDSQHDLPLTAILEGAAVAGGKGKSPFRVQIDCVTTAKQISPLILPRSPLITTGSHFSTL